MKNFVVAAGLIAVVAASTCCRASAVEEDVLSVQANGSAAIVNGDIDGAKKAAFLDAKKNAVEQVGMQVFSETVVENFTLVKDRIITRVDAYVRSYRTLEERQDGTAYIVKLQAEVSRGNLIDDATLLYHDMDKPRIIVIITEIQNNKIIPSRHIEDLVNEFFLAKGFSLVDRETARTNIRNDELRLVSEGDAKTAAKIGRRSGAEVVVVGSALLGQAESVRGILYASKATVSLRAIRSDNASLSAATVTTENSIDGIADAAQRKAVDSAGRNATKDLFWKIVKKWNEEKTAGAEIEIVVTGVQFSQLKKVIYALKTVAGMKEVTQRSFDSPTAVLTALFEGDANRLADILSDVTVADAAMDVQSVSAGKISLRLRGI